MDFMKYLHLNPVSYLVKALKIHYTWHPIVVLWTRHSVFGEWADIYNPGNFFAINFTCSHSCCDQRDPQMMSRSLAWTGGPVNYDYIYLKVIHTILIHD